MNWVITFGANVSALSFHRVAWLDPLFSSRIKPQIKTTCGPPKTCQFFHSCWNWGIERSRFCYWTTYRSHHRKLSRYIITDAFPQFLDWTWQWKGSILLYKNARSDWLNRVHYWRNTARNTHQPDVSLFTPFFPLNKLASFYLHLWFKGAFFWAYSGIGIVGISQTIVCSRATLIPECL